MKEDDGRSDGLSSCGSSQQAVSPVPASIPSARPHVPLWLDQRRLQMRWELYNGAAIFDYPRVLLPAEIDEIEEVLALVVKGLRRTASAIEARSDATGTGAAEGESAGPQDDAQPFDTAGNKERDND